MGKWSSLHNRSWTSVSPMNTWMDKWMKYLFVCIHKYLSSTSVVPGCVEGTRVTKMNETCRGPWATPVTINIWIFLRKKSPICKTIQSWAPPNWIGLHMEGEGGKGRKGLHPCGSPDHVWKHWPGWAFWCLYDRDARILGLYTKPIVRKKGSKEWKIKRFRTQSLLQRESCYRVPWKPRICEGQGFGAGHSHGH